MKITILGSCRQHSINSIYCVTNIQENVSYPHYTKEILQVINFCKYGNLTPDETLYTFRTPILNKNPLIFNNELNNDFNTSDLYIIEIASKLAYKYNNIYLHHIASDDNYNVNIQDNIKNNIIQYIQTKDEIEDDIIKINELLNKKIIIVSHLVTRDIGERYLLKCWLEEICNKYNITFIDPIKELKKKYDNIDKFFLKENILAHYNDEGHIAIKDIYNEYIQKLNVKG